MFDKISAPLKIGDIIIYAKSQGDDLHFSKVDSFVDEQNIIVRNMKTGRVSVNSRRSIDVLNIETIKESHPEYFI